MVQKRNKIGNLIIGIIFILLVLFSLGLIIYNNILNTKMLIILLIVSSLLLGSFLILLILKKVRTFVEIIAIVLCFSLISGYGVYKYIINDLYSFLYNNTTKEQTKEVTEQYYVIVRKDSPISNLEALAGLSINIYNEGTNIYEKALADLNKEANVNVLTVDSPITVANNLINGKIDVIFMSATYKATINEIIFNFGAVTKVIYTFNVTVQEKIPVDEKEIDVTNEPFTIYISGMDTTGKIVSRGRTDANMLVTVNPKLHQILLTSIPRDFYVELYGKNGAKDKLTHSGLYGIETSIKTIETFLECDIDYYLKTNFSTLSVLVNAIGGVDVYSDKSFIPKGDKNVYIKKGINHMNGAMALAFTRERYTYNSGDIHRVQNQQAVMTAILKKVITTKSLIAKYATILGVIDDYYDTNINMDDLIELIKYQITEMPTWQIKKYNLSGKSGSKYTYSIGNQLVYVMIPTQATVDKAIYYLNGMGEGKTFKDLGL